MKTVRVLLSVHCETGIFRSARSPDSDSALTREKEEEDFHILIARYCVLFDGLFEL